MIRRIGKDMVLDIKVEIDTDESGLDEEEIKDNIIDFTRELLVNGATEERIAMTLKEVNYTYK